MTNVLDISKKIFGFILFLIILVIAFVLVSNFFRMPGTNYANRNNVVGIKSEGPLDMVYVGSSEVFIYYNPHQAYDEFGYTSYDMSTEGLNCDAIQSYVKEVLKNQRPSLFVIGVSPFLNYSESIDEGTMRKSTDSLDYDLDRIRLINYYYKHHDITENKLPFYLDIIKYHSNYDAFTSTGSYQLIFNKRANAFKGFVSMSSWEYQSKFEDMVNDDRIAIQEDAEIMLRDLLDYLKSENLNVMFAFSPYVMDSITYARCNYISDVIGEYGYETLNCNDYYDEMGLIFEEDFYNSTHVNSIGAEKFTRFIGNYVSSKYNLPNHHGEEAYAIWDMQAPVYREIEESRRASTRDIINGKGE